MTKKNELFERRRRRVRASLRVHASSERPRLSVFRSNKHIYAQIIDDIKGCTLVATSTADQELKTKLQKSWDIHAAEEVGKFLAQRALKAGIKSVIFDRGAYLYHGRVKALALGARSGGLEF
jgi:large subunit ribosomal protein L18